MNLPTNNHNILATMVATPRGVHFESQRDGETVLLVLRAHLITQVSWISIVVICAILPVFIMPFIGMLIEDWFNLSNAFFILLVTIFWYLILFYYAFEKFLLWFYGVYIITSQRLIDIDFVNFFQKDYTEASLARVQDVSSKMIGSLQVMFNYGVVKVQTAGENPNIEFEDVPQPDLIGKIIGELVMQSGGQLGVSSVTPMPQRTG